MLRTYGRNQPDPLPAHRMLTRGSGNTLPMFVDLTPYAGPIKDQVQLRSCTGHAFSSAIEWIFRKYFGKQPILSPLYFYASELIAQGNFPEDEGSDGTTGSEVSIVSGCCEDSLYPDASQFIRTPTPEMNLNASLYKMGAYHGIANSDVAMSVLGDPTPWPIELGFSVYESFESEATAKTGIVTLPEAGERQLGGHEVVVLGYDISPTETLRPKGCPPAFLIQNSWGEGWGINGRCWMPVSYLDRPDSDAKIVHSGHKW